MSDAPHGWHTVTPRIVAQDAEGLVADVDGVYERAVAAGARSLEAPARMPYGDRRCMVADRWGNTSQIAATTGSAAARSDPSAATRATERCRRR